MSLDWCESYLTDRTQQTKFKKFMSKEETVEAGVPQGSILGPILFICFTNDLPQNFSNCKIVSYADDTQILVSGRNSKDIKKQLERLISIAQSWYTDNSLLINAGKTEVIIVSRMKQKVNFKIEVVEGGKKEKLEVLNSIKVLGIHIDDKLSWNKQVKEVNKKSKFAVRNLNRISQLLPVKTSVLLYNTLVACHFNYADTVWAGCGKLNENKLQRTQNSAVKSMLGMSKYSSATEALQKTHLMPLAEKRKIHEGVYTHKSLSGNFPDAICRQYKQQQSLVNNRSSHRQILRIPRHTTELYKKSPFYRTVATWNSVPQGIKEAETTSTFKHKYQAHKQISFNL